MGMGANLPAYPFCTLRYYRPVGHTCVGWAGTDTAAWREKMKRAVMALSIGLLLLALGTGTGLASPSDAAHRSQPAPVRLFADLECASGGGANVTFTVRNIGKDTLTIENDFHLFLDKVGPGGREPVSAVFVFPAPEFQVIAPGAAKTFLVPIGTGEEGEPGADLSARRLLLEAEIFFEGRDRPVLRHFSFAGCPAP